MKVLPVAEIKELRDQAYTLQAIGDKFGYTKEYIRLVLNKYYGTTKIPGLPGYIVRETLAKSLGCSVTKLAYLEKRRVLKPIHIGYAYFYDKDEAEKAAIEIKRDRRKPDIERICEVCGKKFYVRPYQISPTTPRRFCSKHCQGIWLGKNYGYRGGGGRKKKWVMTKSTDLDKKQDVAAE